MNDVGVVEGGGGSSFAAKTLHDLLVLGQLALEHLDGHHAFKARVEGAVNRAHTPGSDDFADFEIAQPSRHQDRVTTLGAGYRL